MSSISHLSADTYTSAWRLDTGVNISQVQNGRPRPATRGTPYSEPDQNPGVVVQISPQGRAMAEKMQGQNSGQTNGTQGQGEVDQKQVDEMAERDRQVRNHEQAHLAAAGGLARGGASFEYETGPDGKRYAVGGEVSLDTSPVKNDPAATLQKANRIRQAAMAPADPSPQDRRVAAAAAAMANQARQEIAKKKTSGSGKSASTASKSVDVTA